MSNKFLTESNNSFRAKKLIISPNLRAAIVNRTCLNFMVNF